MWIFNKRKVDRLVNQKEALKKFSETRPELEKGDLAAMVFAALLTFLPLIIIVAGLMFFLAWLLGR